MRAPPELVRQAFNVQLCTLPESAERSSDS